MGRGVYIACVSFVSMGRKESLKKIFVDIKSVKIQGATDIAKAAVRAWRLSPGKATARKLLSLRPTEPMLSHVVQLLEKGVSEAEVLGHFYSAQKKMNTEIEKLLRGRKKLVVMTHCHSTNVLKGLLALHKKKKFFVVNTETRPLYQGRKTARELGNAGVKVETFVDSAMVQAVEKADVILFGADALLRKGVVNKIGSRALAELAAAHKKPVYVVADSWKFAPRGVRLEERDFHEVWKKAPKNVIVRNPAFGFIPKKLVKGVISELGKKSLDGFVKAVGRRK